MMRVAVCWRLPMALRSSYEGPVFWVSKTAGIQVGFPQISSFCRFCESQFSDLDFPHPTQSSYPFWIKFFLLEMLSVLFPPEWTLIVHHYQQLQLQMIPSPGFQLAWNTEWRGNSLVSEQNSYRGQHQHTNLKAMEERENRAEVGLTPRIRINIRKPGPGVISAMTKETDPLGSFWVGRVAVGLWVSAQGHFFDH